MNTTVLNTKIGEVDNKIPNINIVKKTAYDAKGKDMEGKYFTTSDYNKFTSDILNVNMKQKKNNGQIWLNPIKAGFFEGSFFWGAEGSLHILRRTSLKLI